jgi:hypothetical protein
MPRASTLAARYPYSPKLPVARLEDVTMWDWRGSARLTGMKSKLAEAAEKALVEATQRLSPEQRVNAFLTHSRLVMQLYEAGRKMRTARLQP